MGVQEFLAIIIAVVCAAYVIRSIAHSTTTKDCNSCGHSSKSNKVQIDL